MVNSPIAAVQPHNLTAELPVAAYVHIPFCRRRCFYCDFPIAVVGDRTWGDDSQTISHYVEILCQEIAATLPSATSLITVFFGGGTPSLLSPAQLSQILTTLDQQFGIATQAEISVEIDPGTFTLKQLQDYASSGVNRVSVGVQAFQPELLAACGRSHTVEQVYAAIALIQQAGLENFSLDLISGLPNQTLEQWQASLTAAIACHPTHLSLYDLTVEPTTVFSKRYEPGCQPLPTDEVTAQMYRLAGQVLQQAGYEHYEISNYARPGYQCRHNRVYWHNQPYYGFGMGATSYVQRQRFSRPRKRQEYFRWVESYVASGGVIDWPPTTVEDELLETLMLGLRLAEGLSLSKLSNQFGTAAIARICSRLEPFKQQGWIEWLDSDLSAPRVRLTDPEGFLFSNVILADLWAEFD